MRRERKCIQVEDLVTGDMVPAQIPGGLWLVKKRPEEWDGMVYVTYSNASKRGYAPGTVMEVLRGC